MHAVAFVGSAFTLGPLKTAPAKKSGLSMTQRIAKVPPRPENIKKVNNTTMLSFHSKTDVRELN